MKLITKLSGETGIYDDGENWIVKKDNEVLDIFPKKHRPFYPLSAVAKYDAIPIDKEALKELADKQKQELE